MEDGPGLYWGDHKYWSPRVKEEMREKLVQMEALFRKASQDPQPERSRLNSRFRYLIDTVFGELTAQFQIKKVWARGYCHLGS